MPSREPKESNRPDQSNNPIFSLLYTPDIKFDSPEGDLRHSYMFKFSADQRTALLRLLGCLAADNEHPFTYHDAAKISLLVRNHPKLQENKE